MRKDITSRFLPIWTEAPMLRFLLPLILGIILQWYVPMPMPFWIINLGISLAGLLVFSWRATVSKTLFIGVFFQTLLISLGCVLVWWNDTSHQPSFIHKKYQDSAVVMATLQEPLQEKAKSYKAEAKVRLLINGRLEAVKGNIIIYLQKDSTQGKPPLGYGNQIIFTKPLQPIHNAGNPGGFDYERYSAFHGLYDQVFLKSGEYAVTQQKEINGFRQMLFGLQGWVVKTFKQYIPGDTESGVAEALLIGYKNDLEQDLVQSYSNTGVVHIIAISGMHLGLIYLLLIKMFLPFGDGRKTVYIRAIAIIGFLWMFSFLTGAAPSIVRSAIMFTFLILGQTQQRKASVYNSLAASAMLLLLVDPFTLWDVGFQLSYAALLSIVVFAKPIANWIYIPNKWLRKAWELNAVTLSAQILTYPIASFHFHQFPNLFLLTNFVAVPLSNLLILGLILLVVVSWIPAVNNLVGLACKWMVWGMNHFIQAVDKLSFALTEGIYFTIPQVLVLFGLITALSWWLLRKSSRAFVWAVVCFAMFCCLRTFQYVQDAKQHRLVVYNVPRHSAVDIIKGNQYAFVGDSELLQNSFLQNFHLKPSRVLYQTERVDSLLGVAINTEALQIGDKKVLFVDHAFAATGDTLDVDLAIITKSPKLDLAGLLAAIRPKNIVVDGSNSYYKTAQWQKEAETLHLRLHCVSTDGAYVAEW